jgi:CBS domain-containing protein
MSEGPATVRPGTTIESLVERMRGAGLSSALVTRSDGTLIGVVLREDAEGAVEE